MTSENEKLVDIFLKKIKKHLPDWIKNNNDKLEDILFEISSHIWDSAQEIAGSDDPDPVSIQEAINRLGNPKEIAKSYKTRGTPKYFISEELWSTYTKVNCYLISIIFIVIALVQMIILEPNNLPQALINSITISYTVILTFITVITCIFIGLSMEGYFPIDLGSKEIIQDEIESYYKPDEFLVSGLLGVLVGLFIIILPNETINLLRVIFNIIIGLFGYSAMPTDFEYVNISMEVQIYIILGGIFLIITGATNLLKIKTKDIRFQLNMNIILIIMGIADLILGVFIAINIHLFAEILPLSENALLFICFLGIIGTLIEEYFTISKSMKLYETLEQKKYSSTNLVIKN